MTDYLQLTFFHENDKTSGIFLPDMSLLLSSLKLKDNNMWVVHYRADNVSQPWSILDSHEKKVSAIIRAYQVSANYFMIKVTAPDGLIVWST